jgi:hypothetical protein
MSLLTFGSVRGIDGVGGTSDGRLRVPGRQVFVVGDDEAVHRANEVDRGLLVFLVAWLLCRPLRSSWPGA